MLLAAVLLGGSFLFLRRMVRGFDEAVATREAVEQRYGKPGEFTPQPDGSIPAARMEAFLRVRDALKVSRERLAETFSHLPAGGLGDDDFNKKPILERLSRVFAVGKEALGIGPAVSDFFGVRNKAMLDAGIGMGEYSYIYTVACYSWLGHSPSDRPRADIREKAGGGRGEIHIAGFGGMMRVHQDLKQILRNQLASLPPQTPEAWRQALGHEIEALAADINRAPWQGGVPEAIAASLAPYRERIEASYSPATNPFELAGTTKRSNWGIQSD